jgi:hypothetical protein
MLERLKVMPLPSSAAGQGSGNRELRLGKTALNYVVIARAGFEIIDAEYGASGIDARYLCRLG